MQTSRNTVNHPIDIIRPFNYTSPTEWAKIVICTLIYISAATLLRVIGTNEANLIVIFGTLFNTYVFSGILAQIQVLACVYLAVNTMAKGYFTAIVINIFGTIFAFMGIIVDKSSNALPGVSIYLGTIVIVTIIYEYRKRLSISVKEMASQKEELYCLHEELTLSQEKLRHKNEQLVKYNNILEDNEKQLRHMAHFDSLTGLPNRNKIIEELDALICASAKSKSSFSFVFIDLDNFKQINDFMGHYIGDIILNAVVERWRPYINVSDVLGRLGGDEFSLIIRRDMSRDDIYSYVDSIRNSMSSAFVNQDKEFFMSASFGICLYPQDGDSSTELLKKSDIAMYNVKNSGKNGIKFFCQTMQNEIHEKILLESGLKRAIANNELYIDYQPQYFSGTNQIRGFEALARWKSPELGQVSPIKFIPVAENSGQIINIGEWILTKVLKKFKSIQLTGCNDYIVSVNISVVQIIHPSFVDMVQRILDDTGFDGRHLEFEVTESVFISNLGKVVEVLVRLKNMGIRIALDDFGTGYASLKNLQILPIDTLKIDKSFIDSIGQQNHDDRLISAIISLIHEFQVTVVAEGVENEIQLDYLTKKGCDCIQGFLLSPPIGEAQLDKLIPNSCKEIIE